jgi:hypothetical protein
MDVAGMVVPVVLAVKEVTVETWVMVKEAVEAAPAVLVVLAFKVVMLAMASVGSTKYVSLPMGYYTTVVVAMAVQVAMVVAAEMVEMIGETLLISAVPTTVEAVTAATQVEAATQAMARDTSKT